MLGLNHILVEEPILKMRNMEICGLLVTSVRTDCHSLQRILDQNQFKEVTTIKGSGDGGGNLFVKTHPKSNKLWADRALSNDSLLQRTIDVYDIATLKLIKVSSFLQNIKEELYTWNIIKMVLKFGFLFGVK